MIAVKEVHPQDICMYKKGSFYHVYDKDANIMAYFFGYKIKEIRGGEIQAGFPQVSLQKVLNKLEEYQINYVVMDRRNQYDVDFKKNFALANQYELYCRLARKYTNCLKRIDKLSRFLKENIHKEEFLELISRLEKIAYERRKV